MAWILDTNVLSELRRPKPEPKVLTFVASRPLNEFYVSAVTLAEFRFGIELLSEGSRRSELNDWLTNKIRPMFDQRVLAVTADIMFKWRILVEEGRKTGHTFSHPDLIIAATPPVFCTPKLPVTAFEKNLQIFLLQSPQPHSANLPIQLRKPRFGTGGWAC